MRILVFSWRDLAHPCAGGAEVYTHQVARCWIADGHDVTLFTSGAEGLDSDDDHDGFHIVRRGTRHSVYREARRFYELEAKGKYDLVIDQINTRPFLCPRFVDDAPLLAVIFQLAREVWFHETPLPVALVGRYILEPWWLRAYRDVPTVTISASSKRSLERYGLRNVTVVPVGFSPPSFEHATPDREERPTLIYVGRLSPNKRPHHVLGAFEQVRRHIPRAQLWIVGSGPMEESIRKALPSGVRLFGRVDEQTKHELLGRAHVLVMTSVREGWGLAVSEAASLGTPTVAYEVDGLRDSVAASGGVLTPTSPAALAEAVVGVLSGDMQQRQVVAGGVLPWSDVADELLDVAPPVVERVPGDRFGS
jgi:glycosyltransferase involved in cell wall biosynthesis